MAAEHPANYFAYFPTRESAEAAAAELGDEFLTVVDQVERPWALKAARPYTTQEEGADHDLEFDKATRHHDGEEDPADTTYSPLDPFRGPRLVWLDEEDED